MGHARSCSRWLRLCNDDDGVAFGRGRVSETRLAAAFASLPSTSPAKNRGMNEPSNPPRNRFLLFHASSNFDGITVTVSWAKKGPEVDKCVQLFRVTWLVYKGLCEVVRVEGLVVP